MYRHRTDPRRLLRAIGRLGLRLFAATATATVVLLVYWNTALGEIEINYETAVPVHLEPTPVVSVALTMFPVVVALFVGRYLARRSDRSRHLVTVAVTLLAAVFFGGAGVSNVAVPIWIVYFAVYATLVGLMLPPVASAAWVLTATSRPPEADSRGVSHEVA